ncbi:MAG: polysaccharide lyase [Elainellaceae cyanobacterium]
MVPQSSTPMLTTAFAFSAIASEDAGLTAAAPASQDGLLPSDRFSSPVYGSSKDDRLYGESAGRSEVIFGGDGRDRLRGGDEDDLLFGEAGKDRLRGDAGNDVLWGGAGDDRLIGDTSGDKGRDIFVLTPDSGTDRIFDFQAGIDRIGLADGLTFGQLEFSQAGRYAAIGDRASGERLALLKEVDIAELGETAFVSTSPSDLRGPAEADSPTEAGDAEAGDAKTGDRGQDALADRTDDLGPDSPTLDKRQSEDSDHTGPAVDAAPVPTAKSAHWRDDFSGDWQAQWDLRQKGAWGFDNFEVLPGQQSDVLRVHYPKGSAAPSVSRKEGVPIGGGQFYADLDLPPQDSLRLGYSVRFSEDFEFVKGGKLPGLFGGEGASGGNIPDGTDGFSARLMWRRDGQGEVYAYLPTSEGYGTSIGRGAWTFTPGEWHDLEQEVVLNQPGKADGQVRVWLDDKLVLEERDLTFRTTDKLKLDGIFFSTFFGGGDRSWSTPKDVHADFANFRVSAAENTGRSR